MSLKSDRFYSENAERLAASYDEVTFEAVHGVWLPLLPSSRGATLDIGAGTGRDARGLLELGFSSVLAVEPNAELRAIGEAQSDGRIEWLDDSLPKLALLREGKPTIKPIRSVI